MQITCTFPLHLLFSPQSSKLRSGSGERANAGAIVGPCAPCAPRPGVSVNICPHCHAHQPKRTFPTISLPLNRVQELDLLLCLNTFVTSRSVLGYCELYFQNCNLCTRVPPVRALGETAGFVLAWPLSALTLLWFEDL